MIQNIKSRSATMIMCVIAICCFAQAEGDEFRLRDRVVLHSLTSEAGSKLNGLAATVIGKKTSKGRYGLMVDDGIKRSIKPANLKLQGPNLCASTDAPKLALLFGINTAQDELRTANDIAKFAKLRRELEEQYDDISARMEAATQTVEPKSEKHSALWRMRKTNPESFSNSMRQLQYRLEENTHERKLLQESSIERKRQLTFTKNDVDVMSNALTEWGFKVTARMNRTADQMMTDFAEFVVQVRRQKIKSGKKPMIVFYVTSHGGMVGSLRYIVCRDGTIMLVDPLMRRIAEHAELKFFLLDCCANTSSVPSGEAAYIANETREANRFWANRPLSKNCYIMGSKDGLTTSSVQMKKKGCSSTIWKSAITDAFLKKAKEHNLRNLGKYVNETVVKNYVDADDQDGENKMAVDVVDHTEGEFATWKFCAPKQGKPSGKDVKAAKRVPSPKVHVPVSHRPTFSAKPFKKSSKEATNKMTVRPHSTTGTGIDYSKWDNLEDSD